MNRNVALDWLKVLLAAFVVCTHSYFLHGSGTLIGDILINGPFRVSVPVFFIINGYFFSKALEQESLIPWLKKVLPLYGIWMVVFLPFYLPDSLTLAAVAKFAKTLVFGYHHLWYVSAFIWAGGLIYCLRNASHRFLVITAIGLFLAGVALQYTRAYVEFPSARLNSLLDAELVSRNFLFMGYPFIITGVLIRRHSQRVVLPTGVLWGLLAVAIGLLVLEAGLNHSFLKGTRHSFDALLCLGFAPPLLFLAVSRLNWRGQSIRLSNLSAFVYFVHPLFISLLVDWWRIPNNGVNITAWTLLLAVLAMPVHDGIRSLFNRTQKSRIPAR